MMRAMRGTFFICEATWKCPLRQYRGLGSLAPSSHYSRGPLADPARSDVAVADRPRAGQWLGSQRACPLEVMTGTVDRAAGRGPPSQAQAAG